MVQDLHWTAIALRLLLTVIAGTVLGMERSKSGHPAGLRTTLLAEDLRREADKLRKM